MELKGGGENLRRRFPRWAPSLWNGAHWKWAPPNGLSWSRSGHASYQNGVLVRDMTKKPGLTLAERDPVYGWEKVPGGQLSLQHTEPGRSLSSVKKTPKHLEAHLKKKTKFSEKVPLHKDSHCKHPGQRRKGFGTVSWSRTAVERPKSDSPRLTRQRKMTECLQSHMCNAGAIIPKMTGGRNSSTGGVVLSPVVVLSSIEEHRKEQMQKSKVKVELP